MDGLLALLPSSDIITPGSDHLRYKQLTTFWAAQINLNPRAVVVPSDSDRLSRVVEYLYNNTELDFAFRGHGYTSLPTKDILISLEHMNEFSYDAKEQTITVGAGQPWTEVYEQIETHAPNFAGKEILCFPFPFSPLSDFGYSCRSANTVSQCRWNYRHGRFFLALRTIRLHF
jgi:FAD/FMN-containing dehydrogenase